MQFKNLFGDDRAVSPVIGVILMVAITVILAAVIGSFVLGLGDQLQDTSPRANFGFDTTTVGVADSDGDAATETDATAVTISHETGDSIQSSNLNVLVNGQQAYTEGSTDVVSGTFTGEVNAGSSITILAATDSAEVETGTSVYKYASGQLNIDGDNDGYKDATPADDVADVGLSSGDEIRVVWTSDSGQSSATLGTFELP